MNPIHGQAAYVIHVRPYRETSVLVTCFTPQYGKINLLAKGVRTPKSPWKALLQPFMPLLISFQGRSELKLLTQCEMHGEWGMLNGNRMVCGLYVNELLYWLLPEWVEHPHLFEWYRLTLMALHRSEHHISALRLFEKHLLEELGYALQLTHDVDGLSIVETTRYTYLPKSGPRPIFSEAARGIAGKTLLDLGKDDLADPVSTKEAQYLLRPMIEHVLDGRPIQTRLLLVNRDVSP